MLVSDKHTEKGELLQITALQPYGHGGGGQMNKDLVLPHFLQDRNGGQEKARPGVARR